METLPQTFRDIVSSASPEVKDAMMQFILHSMKQDKPAVKSSKAKAVIPTTDNISDYVSFIPDFCVDETLLESLRSEAEKLNLTSASDKVNTQWLNHCPDAYIYGSAGHEVPHTAKMIEDYPAICEVMKLVNDSNESTQDMNSCLVSCFTSSDSALSLHADDEHGQIDQNSSICTLSLGAARTMDFCSKIPRPGILDPLKHWS